VEWGLTRIVRKKTDEIETERKSNYHANKNIFEINDKEKELKEILSLCLHTICSLRKGS